MFPNGSVYIITDIIADSTNAFVNFYDTFSNKTIIEGNSNSGTLILQPIKVVTPTQTGTPTMTKSITSTTTSKAGAVMVDLKNPVNNQVKVVSSSVEKKDTTPSNDDAKASTLGDNIKTGLKSLNKGLDTLFHDTIEDIKEQSNAYFPQSKSVSVTDANGKKIKIEVPKYGAGLTYYEPGSYKYSAESYVPDYQDSVVLSRSMGLVPRLKGEFFMPFDPKTLKSIETKYVSSNSLLTNSKGSFITPSTQQTDNVRNAQAQKDSDKLNHLQTNYSIEKTDEQLEYENKVADLLAFQNEIKNYATPAPMNIQTKIPQTQYSTARPTVRTTYAAPIGAAPTVGTSILQKNKNDIFKIGAGAPISRDYLLMSSDQ